MRLSRETRFRYLCRSLARLSKVLPPKSMTGNAIAAVCRFGFVDLLFPERQGQRVSGSRLKLQNNFDVRRQTAQRSIRTFSPRTD